MLNITQLVSKFKGSNKNKEPGAANEKKQDFEVRKLRNWYDEKYDNIVVQRNSLFILLVILLCLSIAAVSVVAYIINSRSFDPFVIQIDDTTGMAKVVNPTTSEILEGNEALAQYFIKKYVTARETYNYVDFNDIVQRTIRLLSSNAIYWGYRGYIRNEEVNPAVKYGQKNTTYLLEKSWSKLSDNKYIFRFSINETAQGRRTFNKIAVVEFQYVPMELSNKDRDINPLGFQVIGYRVDNDSS